MAILKKQANVPALFIFFLFNSAQTLFFIKEEMVLEMWQT